MFWLLVIVALCILEAIDHNSGGVVRRFLGLTR